MKAGRMQILIVDDDTIIRATTERRLTQHGYDVETFPNAYAALERLETGRCDLLLTDYKMTGMDGIELMRKVRSLAPEVEVVLMTAYGTVEIAVEAMQLGAADVMTKPFQLEELELRIGRILQARQTKSELELLRGIVGTPNREYGLVGNCPQIIEVRRRVRQFAAHAAPVLITGETGTGKEVVARALHHSGPRAKENFVAVGCGTIPHELAESELFGHEKGAFTGASAVRRGSFGQADGGTLLLDDVDDLPLAIQVKLLRVLQEGTMTRVGGQKTINVDVRVIATSKIDLGKVLEEGGAFRPDLYYRLRGLEIQLPPLRECGTDIVTLTNHLLGVVAVDEGVEPKSISVEALEVLQRYPWPGNVRELRRALESATVLCPGARIGLEHLPDFLRQTDDHSPFYRLRLEGCSSVDYLSLVGGFEQEVIEWAMRKSGGRQTNAARMLGIPRTTLQSKLAGKTPHA
jgi:two-component system, NtrC family, response regulator